jgi:GalNAc-alpha-(1->4)-GalNAc-alpha-(1->3)-diNAcBac-PP-undecaprenol alpha-1,4-N-acetyl-D-galactosaminyltransferase
MQGKKICIIGPCLTMGGMERASANVANYFAERGFSVLYIAIFKHPHFINLHSDIEINEPNIKGNSKKLNFFSTLFRLRRKIKTFKPDTVLAYSNFYSAIAIMSVLGLGIPIYISDRASPLFKWNKFISLFFLTVFKIFPPTGVIAQTNIAASYQKKIFRSSTKIEIIPNVLRNVTLYPQVRKNHVLAVGRFNDHLKGFDRLIEAYALVNEPNWKLVFAGGNENGEYLKKLASDYGILDKIIFLGKVNEIDRIYSEAGIFVIPSRSEGFPNALCEAMAAGLPCISFDFVAGPKDIIRDGIDGIIVEDGNIKALADAIKDLINDEKKRDLIGKNAMVVRDRYNRVVIGAKIENFILNGITS